MANTFTQLYIHIVFSVKNRMSLIKPAQKELIHKYISGIIKNKNNKLLAINSMPDHLHIFVGLNPDISISSLVGEIKRCSSIFINNEKFLKNRFQWQEGYGAFSYSSSQIGNVIKYINEQEKHHRKKSFKEEYLEILKKFNIKYDLKYIFDENDL
jgi:REP element-mobilizing transposase RayT